QRFRHDVMHLWPERAANCVAAQRQHQSGGFTPPNAEVEHFEKSAGGVGELPLVNDEAGIEFSGENLGDNAIERNRFYFDGWVVYLEREISRGKDARNS